MKPHKKHIWIDNAAARIVLCIAMLAIGYLLIIYPRDSIQWLLLGKLYYKEILVSAIAIFLLTLPVVSIRKPIKDKNSSPQHCRQPLDYQTNRKYSTALQLLFQRNDKLANAIGLTDLIKLRQGGLVDPTRIDTMIVGLDLVGIPLNRANLQGANLQRIEFTGANLQDANLQEADLENANLQEADLENANLKGADLKDAKLQEANLEGANLEGVKNLDPGMLRKAKNWREAILDPTTRQQAEEADRADGEPG